MLKKNDNQYQPDTKELMRRITGIRTDIINCFPFYGRLIMNLKVAFAPIGTAATDMSKIYFDPLFIMDMTDSELMFVSMHELMHCVLNHVIRGKSKHKYLYNVAADIVVNSHILYELNCPKDFTIKGIEPMHTSPDGVEGRLQSVEEVYEKLFKKHECSDVKKEYILLDRHDIWGKVDLSDPILDEWSEYINEAVNFAKKCGKMPSSMSDLNLDIVIRERRVDWTAALKDYLESRLNEYDYNFMPPDRRFLESSFIIPGFNNVEKQDYPKNIWICIDTSSSMSNNAIKDAYSEIVHMIDQIDGDIYGKLMFFSTSISEPVDFESVEDLIAIKPVGRGGTDFCVVFKYLAEYQREHSEDYLIEDKERMPGVMIMITDGHAPLMEEKSLVDMGLDGLSSKIVWLLLETNIESMSWGKSIKV